MSTEEIRMTHTDPRPQRQSPWRLQTLVAAIAIGTIGILAIDSGAQDKAGSPAKSQ